MSIELIGKIKQKNNGTFKLVDLDNIDYDGNGISAKEIVDGHTTKLTEHDSSLSENTQQISNIIPTVNTVGKKNNLVASYGETRFKFTDEANTLFVGSYTKDFTINKLSNSSALIKADSTSTTVTYNNMNLTFNADDVMGVWCYIPKSDINNLLKIQIILSGWKDATYIPNVSCLRFDTYAVNKGLQGGWNFLKFKKSDNALTTPTEIDTIFYCMQVKIFGTTAGVYANVYFDSLVFNHRMKPTVILDFDNPSKTKYTEVYPLLKSYGFPGTTVVDWTFPTATDSTTLTISQIKEMILNGWDYSVRLVPSLTGLGLTDQYQQDLNTLASNGFSTPTMFSSPKNDCTTEMNPILKNLDFKFVRNGLGAINAIDYDTFEIAVISINNTNLTEVKTYIDNCIIYGKVLMIFTHDLTTTDDNATNVAGAINCTTTQYTLMLNYLKTYVDLGRLQMLTPKTLYEQLCLSDPKSKIPSNYNKSKIANPSATVSTFGTPSVLKPPTSYSGISPQAIDIVFGGTFNAETVTAQIIAVYSDGTMTTISKTATTTGTTTFSNSDLMSLIKDNAYIVQTTFQSMSTITSSLATVVFNLYGIYV